MHPAHGREVLAQTRLDMGRKHGDAVLAPFAVANEDRVLLEIDVLHSQTKALHEPKARSIEKLRDQKRSSLHAAEDLLHLLPREHHG